MKEMVGGCCVCSDERGWPDNPLVYCDGNGCTVAVHQACYGIVTVPTGPWYCRKCESPDTGKGKVRCELCPSRSGALKKADTGGWAHVVCALYIPEVRFGNVTSMEPIVLRLIPPERFTRTCYICTENGKAHRASQGACMACNKSGCKQQFHVTCAQSLGLLCEEAGNYLDNVKYCGYCQHHYSKLKKGGNVKTIPPYKPVAHDSHSSGSSSEKEGGASPMAGGSGTPTPHTKGSKGPGRKSSQTRDSSKNSHASKAAPPTTPQTMDTNKEVPEPPPSSTRRHRSSTDKNKEKKKSPSRRQSSTSTGDGASTSKGSTPAPSPSHSADYSHPTKNAATGSTSSERVRENSLSRSTPPSASPNASKSPQTTGGVISSVASVTAVSTAIVAITSTAITTSVVQAPTTKSTTTFQESVITNTDAMETKHTKKRKAAAAAATAAAEQAAQAIANESPGRSSTATIEAESKHNKKRKAVAVAAASAAADAEKETNTDTSETASVPPTANVEPESKYNKKRKATTAVAPAAEPSPAEKETPAASESPSRQAKSPSPIMKSPVIVETQEETKLPKKRKAAAATASAASADKEMPHVAAITDEKLPQKESLIPLAETPEETKLRKKRKAAVVPPVDLPQEESPSLVSAKSPSLFSKSPDRVSPTKNQEDKYLKKRKTTVAVPATFDKEQPVVLVNQVKIPQKASPTATEAETRYSKKRKAASAAATAAASAAAEAREKAALIIAGQSESNTVASGIQWESGHSPNGAPVATEPSEKIVKKAKTDSPPHAHYLSPPPPPPLPLQPPLPLMRSPRHLTSAIPGPSGMNQAAPMNPPSTIRSPSHHQGSRSCERHASLLVSVPLLAAGFGRHFATPLQGSTEMPAPPSPHVFHQPQKPATMESGIPAHQHAHSQRSNWGGLNVSYEMQQDPKPSLGGVSGSSKDHSGIPMPPLPMPPMPPAMRNKKRAAMTAASMANTSLPPPQSTIQMASTSTQSLAHVRRQPPLPPPQPLYQETAKDSPPVSPNTERHLKAKAEQQYYSRMLSTAPHMLGNELNPDSGAAARLQEQLNAELAAHAVGSVGPDPIVPPPLINKAAPGSSSGRSTGAQSLDQLLERQWEQGSQFLMEQAQHFDIASLLSCLHQLRTENVRLEEHVTNLLQRRDHLLAVNARLAIPLNAGGVADSSYQLTFQATAPASEGPRGSRDGGLPLRAPPPPARPDSAAASERDRHDRHADRAQVAQQVSHQMLMREVQQKPS